MGWLADIVKRISCLSTDTGMKLMGPLDIVDSVLVANQ